LGHLYLSASKLHMQCKRHNTSLRDLVAAIPSPIWSVQSAIISECVLSCFV
jgi:hypothetical protein